MAFIHCSCHGSIEKGDEHANAWIHHNEPNSYTNLEAMLINLGMTPNVIVYGNMDFCRNIIEHGVNKAGGDKKRYLTKPMKGQVYINYAAKIGVRTFAKKG